MNIYVFNCSNTFNYGSMMMGENFINYYNQITDSANNYYVETDDEINIQRLRNATGINEIYPRQIDSLFLNGLNKYDYLLSQIKLKNIVSDFARQINLAVVLGGDDFTEDYGWKDPIINAIRFNLLIREGIKVVMLGQTMGPYHSVRVPVMKVLLSKINMIYPRDILTYNYLADLGLKNICLTDDLALLPLAKQETVERTKEYIVFCPSELIYRFSKEGRRDSWLEFNLFMMDTIMKKYPDKKLVLLAHVLKPEHVDDRNIINELYDLIEHKERIIIKTDELYPYEVRILIQRSKLVISSRMHPVVSSVQCGVPAISLSYSSKYWGVIGERFGLGEYIIDVRHQDYNEMKKRFCYLIDKIEVDYKQIEEKMNNTNNLVKSSIMCALEGIRDLN